MKLRSQLGVKTMTAITELKMYIRNEEMWNGTKQRLKREFATCVVDTHNDAPNSDTTSTMPLPQPTVSMPTSTLTTSHPNATSTPSTADTSASGSGVPDWS